MDYELAKKLKTVGFDQEYSGGFYRDEKGYVSPQVTHSMHEFEPGVCYVPTLEELIEACGDDFENLRKVSNFWVAKGKWGACFRESPKEAVASLYLSLRKDV